MHTRVCRCVKRDIFANLCVRGSCVNPRPVILVRFHSVCTQILAFMLSLILLRQRTAFFFPSLSFSLPVSLYLSLSLLKARSMQSSGSGGGDPRASRMGRGGGGFVAAAAVTAVVAGLAYDHARAQNEGRESTVQSAFRWLFEDVLGVSDSVARPSGSSRRRRAGLSRAELDALPVRTFRARDAERAALYSDSNSLEHEKQMCAICQDNFMPEDSLMRLPCLHEYHEDCITSFLSSAAQPICPCCRHPVSIH